MYSNILSMWDAYYINSVRKLELYLHHFSILFTYHSCRLENAEVELYDTRMIFNQNKVASYGKSPFTYQELYNHRVCFQFLKEKIILKEPLSKELICKMHDLLMAGVYDEMYCIAKGELPGYYRKHNYIVDDKRVGCGWEQVEKEMEALLKEINDDYSLNEVLINASYLHAQFEKIHPFADGNRRLGRMVLNYYLLIHDHPPLIVFYEDRKLYDDYLACYDKEGNVIPLYEFLKCETEKTWRKSYQSFERELSVD